MSKTVVKAILVALILGCSHDKLPDESQDPPPPVGSGSAPQEANAYVSAGFVTPEDVRIAIGGTVRWFNNDNEAHHLVSEGGEFDSDVIIGPPGFQPFRDFRVTFTIGGEVSYSCTDHPGTLLGRVVVVP